MTFVKNPTCQFPLGSASRNKSIEDNDESVDDNFFLQKAGRCKSENVNVDNLTISTRHIRHGVHNISGLGLPGSETYFRKFKFFDCESNIRKTHICTFNDLKCLPICAFLTTKNEERIIDISINRNI